MKTLILAALVLLPSLARAENERPFQNVCGTFANTQVGTSFHMFFTVTKRNQEHFPIGSVFDTTAPTGIESGQLYCIDGLVGSRETYYSAESYLDVTNFVRAEQ